MHIQIKNFIFVAMMPLALLALPTANTQSITQVMSGLDNPRHLAFGPEGALYVAEAGRGGSGHVCSYEEPLNAPDRPARSRVFGREFRIVL